MKKLSCVYAILIVMMALVFTGCGDTPGGDGTNSGSGATSIVASYSMTQTVGTDTYTSTLTLYSNGTFVASSSDDANYLISGLGTWSTQSNTLILTCTQERSGSTLAPIDEDDPTSFTCTLSSDQTTLSMTTPQGTMTFTRDNISSAAPTIVATYSATMADEGYPQTEEKFVFYSNGTWIQKVEGTGPQMGSNGPVQGSSIPYNLVMGSGVYTGNAASTGDVTLLVILVASPSTAATSYTNANCPLQAYTGSSAQGTASISANGSTLTIGSHTYTRVTN